LTDSTDAVTSLTSALNGRLIALVTDQRLILYDTRTQRRVQSPEGGATEISCTPTGRVCAGGRWEGGSVGHFVWRLTATSGRVDIVPLPLPLLPVAPGPYAIADNEQFIAYDSREHKLLAWNLARPADNPRELTCSDDEPAALAVSPGSGTLAYATATRIPSKDGSADSFAARIDYCRLAAAGTDPPVTRFPESTQAIRSLLYSSDGKFLGAAGTGGVWLIDAATNATIGFIKDVDSEFAFVPLRDSSSGIASLTDSERTFQLLVTSDSRRITTWEITKGSYGGERLLKHWQEEYAPGTTSLTTLHDSAGTVLSGGADGAVSFWNFDANPLLESARYAAPPAHRPQVSIRSSRFTSEPDELFLIDPRNPRNRPRPIPIRVFNIRAADLNDDATLLAVVKRPWANGTNIGVELWDLKDLAHPQQLPALYAAGDATAVAFGRDGRVALGYQNGRIGVWDVNARREVAELTSPITVVSRSINRFRYPEVESVAFRPDGKLLASSSRYRPLTLWDVESRTLIWSTEETSGVPLQQHVEAELAFSQDGKKLYSRTNGITKVWDVDPHSWAKRALSIASRTPAPLMSLPVAPVAGLARAQSGAKADPRLGYWRYDSGGFSGNVTGTPSRALYIQTIQGELAVTSCGEYAECLKSTPTLNFLALSGAQVEKSLTVLPDGRLEYRMVARVAQGEASALVYYKRADPTDK
jgi:WD40 repeat protein